MNHYRKVYEVVGYAFDADLHCLECTNARFPNMTESTEDSEGNTPTPIFLGGTIESDICGDCFKNLSE